LCCWSSQGIEGHRKGNILVRGLQYSKSQGGTIPTTVKPRGGWGWPFEPGTIKGGTERGGEKVVGGRGEYQKGGRAEIAAGLCDGDSGMGRLPFETWRKEASSGPGKDAGLKTQVVSRKMAGSEKKKE